MPNKALIITKMDISCLKKYIDYLYFNNSLTFYVMKYVSYTSEVYFYVTLYNKVGIPNVNELTFIGTFARMTVFAVCALSNVSHEN